MDLLRSRLVVIVSDDEMVSFRLRRTALAVGANVVASRDLSTTDLEMAGRILAAVVVDLRSAEAAWHVVEMLRRNPATESVPILLRYDARHTRSAELLLSLNAVRGIESERGSEAAGEALGALLEAIVNAASESGTHAWPGRLGHYVASASKAV